MAEAEAEAPRRCVHHRLLLRSLAIPSNELVAVEHAHCAVENKLKVEDWDTLLEEIIAHPFLYLPASLPPPRRPRA